MPLPSWDLKTKEPLTSDPEKYAIETELIFKYSPFKNEQQLMEQFNKIESSSGKYMNVCLNVKRFILGCRQVHTHYFKSFADFYVKHIALKMVLCQYISFKTIFIRFSVGEMTWLILTMMLTFVLFFV